MSPPGASSIDQAQRDKVKEIVHILVNAVSAAKLFPPDHQSVMSIVSDLQARLKMYLDEYHELELSVEEFAFSLGGEKIYEDPHPIKSLPFFFYKDGMQKLYFYRSPRREEPAEFLV